jgi:UDP-N-acetylglucosamine--N-acetylmuramyl-(pentapeptide) pyrophosphoryl-undecaprenol N-acetylglucosamine transferase
VTALLVCTVGGPLLQLTHLASRLDGVRDADRLWVTHDVPQSRSLLEGEDVVFVPYIRERHPLDGARQLGQAISLIRERGIRQAVSTGSAIALPYLGAAATLGRRSVFIESAAFTEGRTRTARILARTPGVETYVQSPELVDRRWRYIGSVFEGYRPERRHDQHPPRRIVVTVGTSEEYGFRRLVERLVEILPEDADVFWQTGITDVSGLGIDARPWVPAAELTAAMGAADLVVAHAGAGSSLAALEAGQRPILVPRRQRHGELKYDHQHQIARRLHGANLAVALEVEELSWDVLCEAAAWGATREPNPPLLTLEPS